MAKQTRSSSSSSPALSRRSLFQAGAAAAALASAPSIQASELTLGPSIYESIGVRPLINCKGTYTIISGSLTLPEVKRAMDEAGSHYVDLDELMNAVGAQLASLTQAPWGIVTAGCAAAMTHTTTACLAGGDPEKMQRLPDLRGMKSEVIIPTYSRNVYDHAIRMLGVKIVQPNTAAECEAAFSERTAMVYILAGPGDEGELGTAAISAMAKKWNVPVLVDAAAEMLTIPNIHLGRGATAVAYSGGKCLRGPQCAGLLLGDKNLLQAAWANSAPHHAFGRSLKVGKEEIMGMLTAVQMWTRRDHKAEWNQWQGWLDYVSTRVTQVPGVTTHVEQPRSLSNHAPSLIIHWDGRALNITGQEVYDTLLAGSPRVILERAHGTRPHDMENSAVGIMPYMMMPGDEKIAAEKLVAVLRNPPKFENPPEPSGEPANIDGQWTAEIQFLRGSGTHTLVFEQHGNKLVGTHFGEYLTGDLSGEVHGNLVKFHSRQHIQGQELHYAFTGTVNGDSMEGPLSLGEYGPARWSAKRHKYA